jgi:FkbM family methyltransferase
MITNILDFIGYRCINIGDLCTRISDRRQGRQLHDPAVWNRYITDDPNEMLRITYPLNETSLVVDLGGYKGEWASRIYARYSCAIDIYEPHPLFSDICRQSFSDNPKVSITPLALGGQNNICKITDDTIYSTLSQNGEYLIAVRKASEVFNDLYPDHIDLLKINIEGSEYEVLPDLIANYDMHKIKNIQIQFHNTIPHYNEKRFVIAKELMKTHTCEWEYPFLYESWKIK